MSINNLELIDNPYAYQELPYIIGGCSICMGKGYLYIDINNNNIVRACSNRHAAIILNLEVEDINNGNGRVKSNGYLTEDTQD